MSKKFLWGGLGALAPILVTFAVADAQQIAEKWTQANETYISGYVVRVFALFLLGGLWAFLHKSEYEPAKLFQLGIVAPAMVTGLLNAANVERPANLGPQDTALEFHIIAPAHAGDETDEKKEGGVDEFIKGVLGK